MSCCPVPCQMANALTWLMCPDLVHVAASVKVLGEVAQERKGSLAERFLQESHAEECIKVLIRLLNSCDPWLCSAAALIFGMLLEDEVMVQKLQEWTQQDSDLCWALGQLLSNDESSVVLNAAGAVASLVETPSGRQWLLQDLDVFSRVLESVSRLLNHERESTINSAALILARLSLSEVACQNVVSHPLASRTFKHLAQCLSHSHTDTAMNAAFTIGRLCGNEEGRSLILAEAKAHRLVNSLQALLSSGAGLEVRQTACFTLSCLASEEKGHALLTESPAFPALLDGLLSLLRSGDPDAAWFAAMTVRFLVYQPDGVIRVRQHSALEEQLKFLSQSAATGQELQEEVSACQKKLRRLPKPSPIEVQHHHSGACVASWERLEPDSGLEVTYSLFNGDTALYRGTQCQFNLSQARIWSKPSLSLRLNLSTADGDASPFSEPVELTAERVGMRPGAPRELRVIGCTATQLQLCWAKPEGDFKPKLFHVYCDNVLVETTDETESVVTSLAPSTTYTVSVCALGAGDSLGPRSCITARTAECREHAPRNLTVVVLGRHELHISWGAPATPLGRLFNYELRLNGCVAYLGTERAHKARRLTANTAYTCTVTAITSRGRYQSKPVTKRTAKDEYLNTSRCRYSPSQQHSSQPLVPPAAVRDEPEPNNKGRKSSSLRSIPKIQQTVHNFRDPDLRKQKNRLPPMSMPAHTTEKSKPSNLTSEISQVIATELDIDGLQNTHKSRIGTFPKDTPNHLTFLRSHAPTKDVHTLQSSHCRSPSHPPLAQPRRKVNPVLLQQCARRSKEDKERLPPISQQTLERVRLLRPVSYNWSELDRTMQEHKQMRSQRSPVGSTKGCPLKGRNCCSSHLLK